MVDGITQVQTTQDVLEWLVANEKELQGQGAFRDGWSLAQEASRLGFIPRDPHSIDSFAREIARLQEDGAIRWTYDTYPNDPRPEPPPAALFTNDYFQRCRDIRLTVTGRQAARAAAGIQINDSIIGQLALRDISNVNLVTLIELLETEVERADASEIDKRDARRLLDRVKDMAGDVTTGTTTLAFPRIDGHIDYAASSALMTSGVRVPS